MFIVVGENGVVLASILDGSINIINYKIVLEDKRMRKTIFAGTLKPHEKIALRGKANKGIIVELGKGKKEPAEEKKQKSFWEKIRSWFSHD